MASRGLEAWKKHYRGKGKTETGMPLSSFDRGSGRITTRINKRTTLIGMKPNVRDVIIEKGKSILVLPLADENEYKSLIGEERYKNNRQANAYIPVEYEGKRYLCSFSALEKPDVRDLGIQTTNLLRGSDLEKINILKKEDVSVYAFNNAKDIATAVITNLNKITKLNDRYDFKYDIQKYFTSNDPTKIEWSDTIQPLEKQQFAVYLGEIILGYALLMNEKSIIEGNSPFKMENVVKVFFPQSQSFRTIDSILTLENGENISISSKAGVGMPGSFFENLLYPMIKNKETIPEKDSILKQICDVASSFSIIKRARAKQIIYEYGIRNVLEMKENEIKDTYKVYEEFKTTDNYQEYSDDVKAVYQKLKQYMHHVNNLNAIRNLDDSTTVFLCIEIAKKLNNDDLSKEQMISFLKGQYYQANLNLEKLYKGEIRYKIISSGEANIKIIGNKSVYNNIDATQGLLNFELS